MHTHTHKHTHTHALALTPQELLKACGRSHNYKEVLVAIDAVHASGLSSWSLDIISGLPRLTMDSWQHTLKEAVAAQPTHMSVYDLQVCLRVRYEDLFGMLACVCIRICVY